MTDQEMIDFITMFEKKKKHKEEEINTYISYLLALADKDNPLAITAIGSLYYSGIYLKQDYAKAKEYYLRAAKLGDNQALINLGYIYYYARCGGKPDYASAYRCFSKVALYDDEEQSQTEAIYKISDMYDKGYFVNKDSEYAFKIIKGLLFQENGQEIRNYPSDLGDILVRFAKFYDKEHQGNNYSSYYFWKYNALANRVIKDRFDGMWFGDKELLKRTSAGIKQADGECLDKVRYSDRNINTVPDYTSVQDFVEKTSNMEFYMIPFNVRIDSDGNLVVTISFFNTYISIPEIGYANKIDRVSYVFEYVTIDEDISVIYNNLINDSSMANGPFMFGTTMKGKDHCLTLQMGSNVIGTVHFKNDKFKMYFGQIVRTEQKKDITISNDKYRPFFDTKTDIHLA